MFKLRAKTVISVRRYFTFQSGYVQINASNFANISAYFLYIPIWLCSNKFPYIMYYNITYFTFQSGYVQMEDYAYMYSL